jgi:hypothetical protein
VLFVKTHPPLAALQESSVHGLLSLQTVAVPPVHVPATHVSLDVHALLSSHVAVLGAFRQPVTALHESSVQPLLSLQSSGVPTWHEPPPHTSAPLHASPSLHGAVLFVNTHPPLAALQESSVHGLLSLQTVAVVPVHMPAVQISLDVHALLSSHAAVLGAFTQPVTKLHESSVQPLLSLQSSGMPAWHEPPAHTSAPLHASPSPHGAVLFAKTHPPLAGLHESSVHGLLSLQTVAEPPVHEPAEQISFDVHALPSSHAAMLFVKTHPPAAALHESSVHPLLSLQVGGGPPTHDPTKHRSPVVHGLPSSHVAVLFVKTHPTPGTHESSVHAFASTQGFVTVVAAIAVLFPALTSGVFVDTLAAKAIEVPGHCVACKFNPNCACVFLLKQLVVHVTTPKFWAHVHPAAGVMLTNVIFAGIVVVHVASSAVFGPLFVTVIVYGTLSIGMIGPIGALTAIPRSVCNWSPRKQLSAIEYR